LEHFLFFRILGRIIPTDFHIFSEGLKPAVIYGKYWDMADKNIIYTLWLMINYKDLPINNGDFP
jgi:hypothetical protein